MLLRFEFPWQPDEPWWKSCELSQFICLAEKGKSLDLFGPILFYQNSFLQCVEKKEKNIEQNEWSLSQTEL